MRDQRTYLLPGERRRVEAAILGLVLAEDWPWRAGELAQRLRLPADLIWLGTAKLRANGLIVVTRGELLRASWAAVRADELAQLAGLEQTSSLRSEPGSRDTPSLERRVTGNNSPEAQQARAAGSGRPSR